MNKGEKIKTKSNKGEEGGGGGVISLLPLIWQEGWG